MKRLRIIILAVLVLLSATMLSGCNQNGSNDKISVVCTIFPQYDWVRQILGDESEHMELTLLLDKKIDLHSYQPSVEDIAKISACDLFIYIGGESDEWVDDVLKEATNKDMVVINLLDVLGDVAKEEEIKEGMEEEDSEHEEESEEHEGEDEHDHEGEAEYDEHVWLSLKNAQVFCPIIADALSSLDANNGDTYRSNLTNYMESLSSLDSEYQTAVGLSSTIETSAKTLVFGDRFPFRYLVDDYGLDYYAAFVGCSAETEASFDTIVFLAEKVDEFGLKNIMVTESSDQSIAGTIRDNTQNKNQQILVLNSMQSVSSGEVNDGATYIGIMESNLNVLIDAMK